ncbi:MAG TPA: cytochrome c biogenesis protein CcsA [Terriglobales bacterium]|nr:cytochrome c biogenesis protein CcsA [Terriglobales bacterium]
MPLLWLRVAVVFYAVGLLYALALLHRRSEYFSREIILPCVGLGMVFHFVSLVEAAMLEHLSLASVHHSESLFAFLIMFGFMVVRVKYKTTSPGIFIFPLVFLLTFASAIAQRPPELNSPVLRSGWVFAHIALIFTGYAALFLSFVASLLYLVQANNLKSKLKNPTDGGFFSRLPALEVIDEIGYRALVLGFPFMTLGLVTGAVLAQQKFGSMYFVDPKVTLSLLMWVVYVVLLYTRWNSGWRGRRAAYLATVAFLTAIGAWAANYFSGVHRFIAP